MAQWIKEDHYRYTFIEEGAAMALISTTTRIAIG
jgi:hypothetical protein